MRLFKNQIANCRWDKAQEWVDERIKCVGHDGKCNQSEEKSHLCRASSVGLGRVALSACHRFRDRHDRQANVGKNETRQYPEVEPNIPENYRASIG